MNEMIETQLNHRTVRFFKDKPLEPEVLEQLLEVMNRTATSIGLQAASMVRVTDPELKEEISKVSKQAYLAKVPELWIFIVDVNRGAKIAEEKGYSDDNIRSINFFLQAFTDACLMAQNVVNAAESLGLGTVYFGSILNDVQKIIDLLKLPKLTMPVLGLGFGEPDDDPELKPRMPYSMRVYENSYQEHDNYLEDFADYDKEMSHYYDTRKRNQRSDSFTNQIAKNYSTPNPVRNRYFNVAEDQGFIIFGD